MDRSLQTVAEGHEHDAVTFGDRRRRDRIDSVARQRGKLAEQALDAGGRHQDKHPGRLVAEDAKRMDHPSSGVYRPARLGDHGVPVQRKLDSSGDDVKRLLLVLVKVRQHAGASGRRLVNEREGLARILSGQQDA
jgi:hypothetical protein